MAEPVVVNFKVGGVADVLRAFDTIKSAAGRAAKAQTDSARKGASEQVASVKKVARESERADNSWRARKRAQERLGEQVARQQERDAKRVADTQAREYSRDERNAKRAEDRKLAAKESAERRAIQIRLNSFRIQADLDKRQAAEAERAAKARQAFSGGIGGKVSGAIGRAFGTAGAIAGTAAALGGGFSVVDSVREGVAAKGKAKQLELNSGGEVKAASISAKSASVGKQFGLGTGEVIDGLDAFVAKAGNVKAGFDAIGQLVELATATGADLKELSTTAGQAYQSTGGDLKQTMNLMRAFAGMGRAGAVDVRELAQYGGRITAGAASFGNKERAAIQLSAIAQEAVATGGATDAAEATTAVQRLSKDLWQGSDEKGNHASGINILDAKTGGLRDPMSIIKDIIAKTGGNEGALRSLLGVESFKSAAGYAAKYREAASTTKGTSAQKAAAGMAAVDQMMGRFVNAVLSEEQVRKESSERMQEIDKRLDVAMVTLKETVAEKLVPKLVEMAPALSEAIPQFAKLAVELGKLAAWLAANPGLGIAAVVAGSLAKDIAAAGIGAMIKSVIAGTIEGFAGGGVKGAVSGAAGAGGTAVGAGLLVGAVGTGLAINAMTSGSASEVAAGKADSEAAKARAGKLGDVAKDTETLDAQRNALADLKASFGKQSVLENGGLTAMLKDAGILSYSEEEKQRRAENEAAIKKLSESITLAEANMGSLIKSVTDLDRAMSRAAESTNDARPIATRNSKD